MNEVVSKSQFVDTLETRRQQWEMLLLAIGEGRMTQPGAAGHWSVKDIIAHVTAYESWLVDWLDAALRHDFPRSSVLDDADIDRRNAQVYAVTYALPLAEVLAQAGRTFQALLAVLRAFPAEDLTNAERTEWFVRPYWTKVTTVAGAIAHLTFEHYDEHIPDLQRWLEAGEGDTNDYL